MVPLLRGTGGLTVTANLSAMSSPEPSPDTITESPNVNLLSVDMSKPLAALTTALWAEMRDEKEDPQSLQDADPVTARAIRQMAHGLLRSLAPSMVDIIRNAVNDIVREIGQQKVDGTGGTPPVAR